MGQSFSFPGFFPRFADWALRIDKSRHKLLISRMEEFEYPRERTWRVGSPTSQSTSSDHAYGYLMAAQEPMTDCGSFAEYNQMLQLKFVEDQKFVVCGMELNLTWDFENLIFRSFWFIPTKSTMVVSWFKSMENLILGLGKHQIINFCLTAFKLMLKSEISVQFCNSNNEELV